MFSLKEWLRAVVETHGFENWHEGMLAGYLLDEDNSVVEWLYGEHDYLLTGVYEGSFYQVYIRVRPGVQLLVMECSRKYE